MRTGRIWMIGIAALGVLAALYLSGCKTNLTGIRFSHKLHAEEASCTECHKGGASAPESACADCHEIDRVNPSAACLTCHTEEDYAVKGSRPASYADLIFDHSAHEEAECANCHGTMAFNRKSQQSSLPMMDACTRCHDGGDAPVVCATCHETVRAEVAPEDHMAGWETRHGRASEMTGRCNYCHTTTGCEECHNTERPRSHTPSWAKSGHGREATFDRRSCATCHQADECNRCHQMKPSSHFMGGFRIPTAPKTGHAELVQRRGGTRSCLVCHEQSFCTDCHATSP